jgi:hypothetical protein
VAGLRLGPPDREQARPFVAGAVECRLAVSNAPAFSPRSDLQEITMNWLRLAVLTILMLLLLVPAGWSQSQSQKKSETNPSAASSTMDDVSKWTSKQWNAAKATWSKENVKWANCRRQAKAKKLSGRKSWQFHYDCMTK